MTKNVTLSIIVVLLALAITVGGCGKKEKETPEPAADNDTVKVEPGIPVQPAVTSETVIPATKLTLADEGELWIQDFEQAKKLASAQGKDILIDFTGSDWCGWCIKLDEEVFAKQAFIDVIPKKFVLLKLDFPRDQSLVTPEIKAQNAKLQKEFGVKGYPTIFLTDATGKQYAQTGYQAGGPEKYIEHLDELQNSK